MQIQITSNKVSTRLYNSDNDTKSSKNFLQTKKTNNVENIKL